MKQSNGDRFFLNNTFTLKNISTLDYGNMSTS